MECIISSHALPCWPWKFKTRWTDHLISWSPKKTWRWIGSGPGSSKSCLHTPRQMSPKRPMEVLQSDPHASPPRIHADVARMHHASNKTETIVITSRCFQTAYLCNYINICQNMPKPSWVWRLSCSKYQIYSCVQVAFVDSISQAVIDISLRWAANLVLRAAKPRFA